MGLLEYGLVVVLAMLAGGWAIPAGVLLDLNPWGVYVAAVVGSLGFTLMVLALGGRARDVLVRRFYPDAAERVAASQAGAILDRWGTVGLAVVGSTVLGPSLTLLAALVLGVDRRRFAIWYVVATVIGFALLTAFWVLVT